MKNPAQGRRVFGELRYLCLKIYLYEYKGFAGADGVVGVVALVVPDFLGCSIMGAGFVLFVNPYNFVPGGVYGMGIVLHNIFPSIQVGTFGYMFDVPLMLTAMLVSAGSSVRARCWLRSIRPVS